MNKNNYIILAVLAVIVVGVFIYTNNKPKSNEVVVPVQNEPVAPITDDSGADKPVVSVNTNALATNSTVVLNGSVNPNGATTTFWYEYGESANLGSSSTGYSIGSGFVAISAPSYIDSLNANTTYRYRLVAKNNFGTVKSEIYSFKTTNEAPLPPGSEPLVTTSEATDIGRTTAVLHGGFNPKGWATTYWFEFGESKELGFATDPKLSGSLDENQTFFVSMKELKAVTQYYFRFNAQNQYGTVKGEIITFTTTGPLEPLAPSVYKSNPTNITSTGAVLKGYVNPNAAKTTYWFEYGYGDSLATIAGKSTPVQVLSDGVAKVTVTAKIDQLKKDTNYLYRIVAKNEVGTTYGDVVYFMTTK